MTHEGQARSRWRPVNAGPGTGGGRPARSFLELRGAELKFGHYGLATPKGWAMVVDRDGDAPFSAPSYFQNQDNKQTRPAIASLALDGLRQDFGWRADLHSEHESSLRSMSDNSSGRLAR